MLKNIAEAFKEFFEYFLACFFGLFFYGFIIFILYLLIVWLPVNVYAESECLERGYPKETTDIFLNSYCITLDGDTWVSMEEL